MAAKRAKAKSPLSAPGASGKQFIRVKIQPDYRADFPTYYVNFVEVAHSRHEFSLTALRAPTRMGRETIEAASEKGMIEIEPAVQLLVPPSMMRGLIDALQKQLAVFEKNYGPVAASEVNK